MKSKDHQFGQQFAKALGDGPGPRAVEAQKERVVAAADRPRPRRVHLGLVLVGLIVGLAGVGALLWLLR